ncbi:MAG: dTDP-4-dehydrorhamnose 3,5-epimerase [Rickettsiaceae bacterium]
MKFTRLEIPEVVLLEPKVFSDDRGFFFESFNHNNFEKIIEQKVNFVQDNQSCSHKGVLRGMHYQLTPKAQGKLVRIITGEVFDVAVDIRKNSPTFGKWVGAFLSGANKKQLWIPAGFAHGFLSLADSSEMLYKTTDYYAPELEKSILWSDSQIGIEWPLLENIKIVDKDAAGTSLIQSEVYV